MAGLNTGDIILTTVNMLMNGQKLACTFPYRVTQDSANVDPVAACIDWSGDWTIGAVSPFTALVACLPPEVQVTTVTTQKIQPVRYAAGVYNYNQPGTNEFNSSTSNTGATITRKCQQAGRRFVGFIQIPGLAQENVDNGLITNGYIALMSTVASRMLNVFSSTSDGLLRGEPGLIHRVWNPVTEKWEYDGFTKTWQTIPQRSARVMRRRTVGVGK